MPCPRGDQSEVSADQTNTTVATHRKHALRLKLMALGSAHQEPGRADGGQGPPYGKTWTNPKDGSEMVYVPAGTFKMGSNEEDNEKPIHDASLGSFYIGKYEVTNKQFKKFVDANPQWGKGRVDSKYASKYYLKHWNGDTYPSDKADHPVVYVDWHQSIGYCSWVGKRLPTEAEWEKAARGTDGRTYPWGNEWDANKANASRGKGTAQVGSFDTAKSPYGTYDMAGNVWEWTQDWYSETYYSRSPIHDPTGPASGSLKVIRGGAWSSVQQECRTVNRATSLPGTRHHNTGFRLVVIR